MGEGARRPACWHQPGLRAPFFCGDGSSARASYRHRKHRDTDRSKQQGRLGQAMYRIRLPDLSYCAGLSLPERAPASDGGRTLSSSLIPKDILGLIALLTSSDQTLCNGGVRHASYSAAISGDLLSAVISIRCIWGFRKDNPNVFNMLVQNLPQC